MGVARVLAIYLIAVTTVTGDGRAHGATGTLQSSAAASIPATRIDPPDPRTQGPLPLRAEPVDTSEPDRVVGSGTSSGCTSAAVVDAVAAGGVITFDCGPDPVTIEMDATAKVVNTSRVVVLDGGGLRAVNADADDLGGHQSFWFAWSWFHPGTRRWSACVGG